MTVEGLIPVREARPRSLPLWPPLRLWRLGDRRAWLCAVLALCVVLPRSILITRAHSECVDDDYHLDHGMCVLLGTHHPLTYNDPPFGEVILALPLYAMGVRVHETVQADSNGIVARQRSMYHGQRYSPDTLRTVVAVWKALLFVPAVVVAFGWVRRLYGARSAWLAAALLLVEPTIAAHTPVAALDVLAMEAVIIASYLVWRCFEQPSPARLMFASVATATAMSIKHTAIVLPAAFVALALLHWFVRPWWQGASPRELAGRVRPGFNALAAAAMVVIVSLWPLTLFDVSRPGDAGRIFGIPYEPGFSLIDDVLHPALESRWPAGIYIGSVFEALQHGREGHSAYLWGEVRDNGWWYYFFAVALYKVPVGIALMMALAAASLYWVRPKWDELFVLVPALACGALVCAGGINIGFRHALPAYGMLLLLASRCAAPATRAPATRARQTTGNARLACAWAAVVIAAVHVASYHPDYLSYINGPWQRPWLAISDSNLDWGQTLRQLDRWLEQHPLPPDRPIHFDSFDEPNDPAFTHYVRHARRLTIVPKNRLEPPTRGLLITCPSWLGGTYRRFDVYAHLRNQDPAEIIGHALLVYDLDARTRNGPGTKDE